MTEILPFCFVVSVLPAVHGIQCRLNEVNLSEQEAGKGPATWEQFYILHWKVQQDVASQKRQKFYLKKQKQKLNLMQNY